MLAAGDHTLTFKSENDDDSHKHCVYVKLTDSSAKVIEEYLKNRDSTTKKPTIVFQKDKGEISFPLVSSSKSSAQNADANSVQQKKFFFALSSVKESNKDSSASFECISYTESKLKTIGTIEQKLTVQANDEVFLATKERVNIVEEEAKKNSIRELAHPSHRNRPSNPTVIRRPVIPPAPVTKPSVPTVPTPIATENVSNNINNNNNNKPKPAPVERPTNQSQVQSKPLKVTSIQTSLGSPHKSTTSAFVSIPKHKPIESKTQWEQSTQEFTKLYPEYEDLRVYVENLAQMSSAQKAELEKIADKSSAEYLEKSNEIIQTYLKLQRDQNHLAKQERYRYLEHKLGRMYQQIRQYEESVQGSAMESSQDS